MTPISQSFQLVLFAYAMVLGAALGGAYDVFRILRIAFPCPGKGTRVGFFRRVMLFIIFLEDVLFALLASICVNLFLFNLNDGQIRWYALLGVALGFILWYFTVGRLIMLCASAIIHLIHRIFAFLFRILLFPFVRIGRLLGKVLQRSLLRIRGLLLTYMWQRRLLASARRGFDNI